MCYKKTSSQELNNLMTTIYQQQRSCHNYEYWSSENFNEIEGAMYIVESKLKAQQELINKLQKEKAEFVELLKLIKIVHYDNLPMCHSEWSLLDSDVEKKIKKILGEDKSLQTSEDHVQ